MPPSRAPGLPAPVWLRFVPRSGSLAHSCVLSGRAACDPGRSRTDQRPAGEAPRRQRPRRAHSWRLLPALAGIPPFPRGPDGNVRGRPPRRRRLRTAPGHLAGRAGVISRTGASSSGGGDAQLSVGGPCHARTGGTPVSSRFKWAYCSAADRSGNVPWRSRVMKIAVLGLGNMGLALSERLLQGGHHLTVWNRSKGRADPLLQIGATEADTPACRSDLSRGGHHEPRQRRRGAGGRTGGGRDPLGHRRSDLRRLLDHLAGAERRTP